MKKAIFEDNCSGTEQNGTALSNLTALSTTKLSKLNTSQDNTKNTQEGGNNCTKQEK